MHVKMSAFGLAVERTGWILFSTAGRRRRRQHDLQAVCVTALLGLIRCRRRDRPTRQQMCSIDD